MQANLSHFHLFSLASAYQPLCSSVGCCYPRLVSAGLAGTFWLHDESHGRTSLLFLLFFFSSLCFLSHGPSWRPVRCFRSIQANVPPSHRGHTAQGLWR